MLSQALQFPILKPQSESMLLRLPTEVRDGIYEHFITSIHVFVRNGNLGLSECEMQHHPEDEWLNGIERKVSKMHVADPDPISQSIWARRLRSSWGSHWKCEEVAESIRTASHPYTTLLLVCKQIYHEFLDAISHKTLFEVTGLETLRLLSQRTKPSPPPASLTGALPAILPQTTILTELSITLRLPLNVCKALENVVVDSVAQVPSNGHPETPTATCVQTNLWLQLPKILSEFKNLRRLHIWLDHDDRSSWTVVNERALISHIAPLAENPDLKVSLSLPKLHPRWEQPDRHFTDGSPLSLIPIHRRLRQTWHAIPDVAGQLNKVEYHADFPILVDFFLELQEMQPNIYGEEGMSTEEKEKIEKTERDYWKSGLEADQILYMYGVEQGYMAI